MTMTDPQTTQTAEAYDPADDATPFEIALYVVGILLIPLVPIFMVAVFTPFSGIK